MPRWTYIIPRLIILGLIFLALWAGADPLTRQFVVHQLEDAAGAKVDIGQLRFSLSTEKLFLKDVMVADRREPTRNLVQADMAYLDVDLASLWNRRLVIRDGQTSRVIFGSPRTTSGKLDNAPATPANPPFEERFVALQSLSPFAQTWLDSLEPVTPTTLDTQELHLVRVATDLEQQWDPALSRLAQQVQQIQKNASTFKQAIQQDDGNPLRDQWRDNWFIQLESVQKNADQVRERVRELAQQLETDRGRLQEAREQDAAEIANSIHQTRFQADDLSRLLLDRMHAQYVDQIVNHFRWFRQALPDPAEDFRPKLQRGINFPRPGSQGPQFLIKNLELNGEGEFLGQHFNFSGRAHDLTPQPRLHDQPARFELRAQGQQHVIVTCVLDRRTGEPVDQLQIVCPELEMDEQKLGDPESLWVTLGPAGLVQADVDLTAHGDQLAGTITLRHRNLSFHVDHLHELAGGETTALHMNQGLALVKEFDSTIEVFGEIDQYQHRATSDLGQKFAAAANSLLSEKKSLAIGRRQEALKKMQQLQEAKLNDYQQRLQSLAHQLQGETSRIAELRSRANDRTELRNRFR